MSRCILTLSYRLVTGFQMVVAALLDLETGEPRQHPGDNVPATWLVRGPLCGAEMLAWFTRKVRGEYQTLFRSRKIKAKLTFPPKVLNDSLGWIGILRKIRCNSRFPLTLGS